MPGLAKTLAVRTLARQGSASAASSSPRPAAGRRRHRHADLPPAQREFTVKKGPVFANLVLADEINRAPAKVQSALLEAMAEKQVTIGEGSFALDELFLVLAMQNPIEQEGTGLPEAQVDRFMLKPKVDYPTKDEGKLLILDRMSAVEPGAGGRAGARPWPTCSSLVRRRWRLHGRADQLPGGPGPRDAAAGGVRLPGPWRRTSSWAPARGRRSSRARASVGAGRWDGQLHVTPADVKAVAPDVLRHRVAVTYEAEAEEPDRREDPRPRPSAQVAVP
ncbi:MAG: AAA family ATPase [Gemmataceae bacterium]